MSLNLKSSGGGSVTIDVPSTASNYTATLPAGTGNVVVNGVNGGLVSGTVWTYSSGTPSSIDFTGIPSWVKRITINITGLSYAAAGVGVVQIGSGSLTTSGYTSNSMGFSTTPSITTAAQTGGFGNLSTTAAATTINGIIVLVNQSANTWSLSQQIFRTTDNVTMLANGYLALSGTLDRLSLVATTSTFDAGSVNIIYE